MIKTLFLAVFKPKRITNEIVEKQILRFGLIFILIRWLYYSIVFYFFRDYQNDWAPFSQPPFGLTIETYAFWQSNLAVLFGFFLMSMMACGLFVLFRIREKDSISYFKILNILGVAYFVPFLILQPLDKLTITIFGWIPLIIIPLHTSVLVWEAIISIILIDKISNLKLKEKLMGVFLQIAIWIFICTIFWR
jgi:hypothetical protein